MTHALSPISANATVLHRYLQSHVLLNGGNLGLPIASYSASLPATISVQPDPTSKVLECCLNVKKAVDSGDGNAVFGWALWEGVWPNTCSAQPHAVLERMDGRLDCITPLDPAVTDQNSITFFADPRIPFDYKSLRVPPMLAFETTGSSPSGVQFAWVAPNERGELEALFVSGAWSSQSIPDNFRMCTMGGD